MSGLSQSHFLQSLGWATLNSFWQMALLWCLYVVVNHLFQFSSNKKYQLSVTAVVTGFVWFLITFTLFITSDAVPSLTIFNQGINTSASFINSCLISASIAYLILLLFPSYKLLKNWHYVQRIKKTGLRKANLQLRLFTQKISGQLSIGKKVSVFISEIVSSPLTIGFLKPIILLPVASINNLSPQQVEAVLLHELSHIKRYDYLINFIISIIHTLLYFNPFVKQFVKQIEAERENCCDDLVLQFGYDKVSYASALLTLEKSSIQHHLLALGATGKKNILNRIEKIIGMPSSQLKRNNKRYSLAQMVPMVAALFIILAFNSLLIIKETKQNNSVANSTSVLNPFYFIENATTPLYTPSEVPSTAHQENFLAKTKVTPGTLIPTIKSNVETSFVPFESETKTVNYIIPVNYDEIEGSLTKDQKDQVKSTVDATKKVMSTLQWQEVEKTMADAMSKQEIAVAKQQYMQELDAVNWQNIEKNMKANYEKIDWSDVNTNLNTALTTIQLDSIQRKYTQLLSQFIQAETEFTSQSKNMNSPLPDHSLTTIKKAKEDLRRNLETIKALRSKKIIHL